MARSDSIVPARRLRLAKIKSCPALVLKMLRGAAITGMIRDERGQPAPNVSVRAMQFRTLQGEKALVTASGSGDLADTTDDRGVFRLYGLSPGDYIISTSPREAARRRRAANH